MQTRAQGSQVCLLTWLYHWMNLLQLVWLPVSGLEDLLSATTSTGAAADAGLVVCAGVGGLWAAAGWTGVLASVPASAKRMNM